MCDCEWIGTSNKICIANKRKKDRIVKSNKTINPSVNFHSSHSSDSFRAPLTPWVSRRVDSVQTWSRVSMTVGHVNNNFDRGA